MICEYTSLRKQKATRRFGSQNAMALAQVQLETYLLHLKVVGVHIFFSFLDGKTFFFPFLP